VNSKKSLIRPIFDIQHLFAYIFITPPKTKTNED